MRGIQFIVNLLSIPKAPNFTITPVHFEYSKVSNRYTHKRK